MDLHGRTHLVLGLALLAFALFTIFVWVPMDSATGLLEQVRRRVVIGDALAPTIAASFIALGSLLLIFEQGDLACGMTSRNILYLAAFLGILISSILVMLWLGPMLAALLTDEGYRVLRDTAPWKHIGFVVGGTAMVGGLISYIEGHLSIRSFLIGLGSALALVAVYDLPFDDLLLPPNGDV